MPRVHVNTLLKHATENKYGVAAVNTLNVETVKIYHRSSRKRAGTGNCPVLSGL